MILTSKRASAVLYNYINKYNRGTYLLPANVCPIVPLVFKLAEIHFEFIDIQTDTLCIDESVTLELISKNIEKYQGVVFVRSYGYLHNTDNFFEQLHLLNPNLKIIDDRCLCIPETNDISQQSKADLTLYSTGYGKSVDIGIGGYGFVSDNENIINNDLFFDNSVDIESIYKNAINENTLINHIPLGWLDTSKMNLNTKEYFLKVQEKKQSVLQHKEKINKIYTERLERVKKLKPEFQSWRYNILVEDKSKLLENIFTNKLFASSHYRPSSLLFSNQTFKNSLHLYNKIINLFNDFYITEDQAKIICDIINKSK